MPRPKKPGVEPKRRSRNGCWPCKARKVKCGEEKPHCTNCERQSETCDYSIRLNWGGRSKKVTSAADSDASSTASGSPYQSTFSFQEDVSPLFPATSEPLGLSSHGRSPSNTSVPTSNVFMIDSEMFQASQPSTPSLVSTPGWYSYPVATASSPYPAPYYQSTPQTSLQYPAGSTYETLPYASETNASPPSESAFTPPSMAPPRDILDSQRHTRQKQSHSTNSPVTPLSDAHSPYTGPLDPYSPYIAMPLTPSPSVSSNENISWTVSQQNGTGLLPDLRRMSVQSLINNDYSEHSHTSVQERRYPMVDSAETIYGYDLGRPDLDTPNNDDFAAIAIFSPQASRMGLDDDTPYENAQPRREHVAFESGGYYAKPVPIRISKSFGPLPPVLMENPMNLLYFHHFLNHTARILVPHDCERNPFRQILPEMAVADENIMNLLLAYSAAHRARMLNHREPSNRIAVWVQDVFPKLRQSLIEDPNNLSDNTLAAVIMMASLEIICSGTFEVPVTWQEHLKMARQMIMARGGPRGIDRDDHIAYFLSKWFAYLDVMGSLSGNKNDVSLGSSYWCEENNTSADEDFEIDCLLGFTTHCVGILARISELARACETQRIDEHGNVRQGWVPDPDLVRKAVQIRRELEGGLSKRNIRIGCKHGSSTMIESEDAWDAEEIYATNEMFHWAGLIHLYRRVLGKPASDIEVQNAVREIVGLLYKIRPGSTAEACLMFPMFAAGCDTADEGQRTMIMERLRTVEGFGMTHTPQIATLLQSVWDTGKPWESLVSGEFFG
ncbi:fungal-specific transcription factor domain-containing protein [Phaeosphaeria sp. MPI-PUGE-AT-0046c]|nr:fungal-specific transcription factor domain-containing protein [Phaeosphaeria sp. MPI-PUGE-AT-0046c]